MQVSEWGQAFAGGMLIGLGAIMLMLFNGRIAGISGIAANAFTAPGQSSWRWAFLVGLVIAPLLTRQFGFSLPAQIPGTLWLMAAAGLLVGIGTQLGSGCTSGHGICGLARFSPRSLLATLVFMGSGIVTVTLARHLL
ncbi:YeeE/YedE family protein [Salinimonas sediminis]